MSLYVMLVEYIRNCNIKDISKFALDYNPLTKAYTISRWDYTEENDNGITRPTIQSLSDASSIDWTAVVDELKMNSLLLPKHLIGDTFCDAKIRLYSWFLISARTALDTERSINLGFRSGNRLVAETGSSLFFFVCQNSINVGGISTSTSRTPRPSEEPPHLQGNW